MLFTTSGAERLQQPFDKHISILDTKIAAEKKDEAISVMAQQELETSDNFLPRSEPALESPTMTKSEEDVDLILDGVEKLSCHIIVAELH